MKNPFPFSTRIDKARVASIQEVATRAKSGMQAYVKALTQEGKKSDEIIEHLADGTVAQVIGRIGLSATNPTGLACSKGCSFCCILLGDDGGTITEKEAITLYSALIPFANRPDGRSWHPRACPSLNPETLECRAYEARPMICRSYISPDLEACKKVSNGETADGPGTLAPYHTYLASLGISRAVLKGYKRVSTFSMFRLASEAIAGTMLEEALSKSRHTASELDAELKRSKKDLLRAK